MWRFPCFRYFVLPSSQLTFGRLSWCYKRSRRAVCEWSHATDGLLALRLVPRKGQGSGGCHHPKWLEMVGGVSGFSPGFRLVFSLRLAIGDLLILRSSAPLHSTTASTAQSPLHELPYILWRALPVHTFSCSRLATQKPLWQRTQDLPRFGY